MSIATLTPLFYSRDEGSLLSTTQEQPPSPANSALCIPSWRFASSTVPLPQSKAVRLLPRRTFSRPSHPPPTPCNACGTRGGNDMRSG